MSIISIRICPAPLHLVRCGLILILLIPIHLSAQDENSQTRSQPEVEVTDKTASNTQQDKMSEDELWKLTREKHTESVYRQYKLMVERGMYSGKYLDQANDMILEIREDNVWTSIVERGNVKGYREYLEMYPGGKYTSQAQKALRSLAPARKTAPANSTPPPKPKTEITISANPEDSLWNEIFQNPSEEAYRQYLHDYPEGKYLVNALKELPILATLERSERDVQFQLLKLEFVKYPISIVDVKIDDPDAEGKGNWSSRELIAKYQPGRDSSYTYIWKSEDFIANIESMGGLDAVISLGLGNPITYQILFEDALGRQKSFRINTSTPQLELIAVWGKGVEEDSLFVCMTGGVAPYSVRLNRDGSQFFQLELPMKKHQTKPDTWYLLKKDVINEYELDQPYYLVSFFDAQHMENISFDQEVFFQKVWDFDWLISWEGVLLLVLVIALLSWLIFRYGRMII